MIQWFVKKVLGSKNQREVKRLWPIVQKINEIEVEYQSLMDEQLIAKTTQFRERVGKGEKLDDILPEAFAVVKNACRRLTERKHKSLVRGQEVVWEMIPFDVQLIGGMVLHSGRIAEMATGEGKTLVATFPAYLNALTGRGVHVVTVNDYLAARDSEWMGEVYRFLNLTIGCIQHGQIPEIRRLQYYCDIVYGTNAEMGFDYLRDNGMATSKADQVQRGHPYGIVNEVDSILIDEARTPLIIAGPATVSSHQYDKFKGVIERIVYAQSVEANRWAADARKQIEEGNYEEAGRLLFKIKNSTPTNKQLLKMIEEPELRRAMDDAELALYQDPRKTELYKLKEEAYFSIDPKTNESDLSERGRTYLNPDDPDMFVLPDLITRFHDIDANPDFSKEEKQRAKANEQANYDQASERIHNISQLLRAYCVYEKDVQYVVQENKVVIVNEYTGRTMPGRRWSDGLHQAIEAKEGVQIDRETQTLATITIQNYFRLYQKLSGMTGTAETEANEFHDIYKLDVVVIPTNRPIARVDLDDIIYKTRGEKLKAIVREIKSAHSKGQPVLVGTIAVESSELLSRMLKREGIVHNVLNAKFVQQEAEIVANAGQRGAVTIATNMAGRGTDIKLGPGVNKIEGLYIANAKQRVVEVAGPETKFDPDAGEHFTSGLYVIGTERHESRRIDRQLRGRCARQGDPGVSKFFVSFEDDLMRNFGDSRRLSGMMTKLGMKDDEELQHPWLNRSVESAQRRVEERNYVSRKYTLQYDDVMNQQRTVIYAWRNDILVTETPREEIFEVVHEVIEGEIESRLTGPEASPSEFVTWLNNTFPVGVEEKDFDFNAEPEAMQKAVLQRVRDAYEIKIKFEDPNALQSLERYTLLGSIDRLWQEHLYAIDSLRHSINLRTIGQKDPLVEYKREAYTMFSDLMARIRLEIASSLFRTSASITAFESFLRNLPQKLIHETPVSAMSTPDPAQAAPLPLDAPATNGEQAAPPERQLPIRHQGPVLARNDACPKGTGKKFKYCCGADGKTKVCTRSGTAEMTEPLEALRGYVHFLREHEGVRQVRLTRSAQQGLAVVAAAGSRCTPCDGAVSGGPGYLLPGSPKATGSEYPHRSVQPSLGGRRLPEDTVARSATATNDPPLEISGSTKMEQLRHLGERASVCVKCPNLAARRHTVVFGVGNPDAKLMFVGEAPGEEEDLQGEPFVGRAGQLLTKMITAMGLTREQVYIANIVKCRPDMPPGASGNRKPTKQEMETCVPYLRAQIDVIKPSVMVALGATAVEGLLGPVGTIGSLRGKFLEYRGTPLMPTYHPSYLLRNQSNTEKRKVWEDLLKVMDRLEMPISDKQRGFFLAK